MEQIKRKDECFKCSKRKCRTRIVTSNYSFNEIACDSHIRDLELYADKKLGNPGKLRNHISSTAQVARDQLIQSYEDET